MTHHRKRNTVIRLSTLALLAALAFVATPAQAGLPEANAAMVREDYATAIREATPLAETGNADAAYMLAILHLHGRGTPQSARAAVGWFRRAADKDHAAAQLYLGRLTMVGQGTSLDFVEAYKWFALSARNGNAAAKRMVPSIKRQLTSAQLALAKKRIAAWKNDAK